MSNTTKYKYKLINNNSSRIFNGQPSLISQPATATWSPIKNKQHRVFQCRCNCNNNNKNTSIKNNTQTTFRSTSNTCNDYPCNINNSSMNFNQDKSLKCQLQTQQQQQQQWSLASRPVSCNSRDTLPSPSLPLSLPPSARTSMKNQLNNSNNNQQQQTSDQQDF